MSREQGVDNDRNEQGALYCGVFGGVDLRRWYRRHPRGSGFDDMEVYSG
jgi:hypothetical protein